MRPTRNYVEDSCYHLSSRMAHRALYFDDEEKGRFVDMLLRTAAFSGIDLLAWCVMTNHFHVLVYVPKARQLADGEVRERIAAFYRDVRRTEKLEEWDSLAKPQHALSRARLKAAYLRRMWSPSEFMKTLKQSYTMSFNGRHSHFGTMWESRYRAKRIARGDTAALCHAAGCIDMNPYKARLVADAAEYPWSSLHAAYGGGRREADGYAFIYGACRSGWNAVRRLHEKTLAAVKAEIEAKWAEERALAAELSSSRWEKLSGRRRECIEPEMPPAMQELLKAGDNRRAANILALLSDGPRRPAELRAALGISSRNYFTATYLRPLVAGGYIEQTRPGSPNSSAQMYRLTRKGANHNREADSKA